MFFDSPKEIVKIASKIGCGVFVMPDDTKFEIKNAIVLQPEERVVITIEQVRDVTEKLLTKQKNDIYIIVRPADKLSEEAENAFLKNLEEPGEKIHFILVTSEPSRLLPTVLSRSAVYFLRSNQPIDGDIKASAKTKELAKRLIVAKATDLIALADEITKKKDGARERALDILGAAIEMLYKSYYKTDKIVFINKLPKFLKAYENIENRGHVKLHLVADLL